MTVKEYNEIYSKVSTCNVAVSKLNEVLKEGNLVRLKSLIPEYFTEVVNKALAVYLVHEKQQISREDMENMSNEELLSKCIALSMQLQEEFLAKPQNFEYQKTLNAECITFKNEILKRMGNLQ